MKRHIYHIVDFEGFILCEIRSQPTNASFDDNAKLFINNLLPVIAKQYGIRRAYYTGGE